jgi:hypothetical protein
MWEGYGEGERERPALVTYTVFQFQNSHTRKGSLHIEPPCLINLHWHVEKWYWKMVYVLVIYVTSRRAW